MNDFKTFDRNSIPIWRDWANPNNTFLSIKGYAEFCDVLTLHHLDKIIESEGAAVEIGVHHGRYSAAMNYFPKNTKLYAFDIWNEPLQNTGPTQCGTNEMLTFQTEMNRKARFPERIVATQINSFMNKRKIVDIIKEPVRIFHVDGGHDVRHVLNDLSIADEVMAEDGVVIIDDFFNMSFPGITEAVYLYLQKRGPMIPFLQIGWKLFLCSQYKHLQYRDYWVEYNNNPESVALGKNFINDVDVAEYRIPIYAKMGLGFTVR